MKIIIPGGSGQVGGILANAFDRDGHDVVVLSRGSTAPAGRLVPWDGSSVGGWADEFNGADVVINLAGRNVNCRYNRRNREAIMDSRVESTRVVGDAIKRCAIPPRVWLQASTATIYAHRFDAGNDESSGIIGGHETGVPDSWRYSIDVAQAWERTLSESETPATRKVALRSAVVLSPDRGGIFDVLLGLVRRGLGGTNGNGRQYVSWIHHEDFVRAIYWLMERDDVDGVVNLCSPCPVPNAEFMRAIREAWGTRIGLPSRAWMLEVGAVFLRTETELVLKSRRVVPGRLIDHGFAFEHPDWAKAARDLCASWRAGQRAARSDRD